METAAAIPKMERANSGPLNDQGSSGSSNSVDLVFNDQKNNEPIPLNRVVYRKKSSGLVGSDGNLMKLERELSRQEEAMNSPVDRQRATSYSKFRSSVTEADLLRERPHSLSALGSDTSNSLSSDSDEFEELFDPSLVFLAIYRCYYWDARDRIRKGKMYLTRSELLFKCSGMPFVRVRIQFSDIASIVKLKNYKNSVEQVLSVKRNDNKSFIFYKFILPKSIIKNTIETLKKENEEAATYSIEQSESLASANVAKRRLAKQLGNKFISKSANIQKEKEKELATTNSNDEIERNRNSKQSMTEKLTTTVRVDTPPVSGSEESKRSSKRLGKRKTANSVIQPSLTNNLLSAEATKNNNESMESDEAAATAAATVSGKKKPFKKFTKKFSIDSSESTLKRYKKNGAKFKESPTEASRTPTIVDEQESSGIEAPLIVAQKAYGFTAPNIVIEEAGDEPAAILIDESTAKRDDGEQPADGEADQTVESAAQHRHRRHHRHQHRSHRQPNQILLSDSNKELRSMKMNRFILLLSPIVLFFFISMSIVNLIKLDSLERQLNEF